MSNAPPQAAAANITLRGNVQGGQQPVVGATIQLYAADLTSYTGTSKPLITSAVVTGQDGSFSITGTYTCDPGALVYLTATGGNPGAGINTASAMMTALGPCSNLTSSTFIFVNEVTTVASVYALSGFMSSLTSVSANATPGTNNGTAAALTGITNAFAIVNNLIDTSTGLAHSSTPTGNGTIPLAKIDSLANILAACVNSTGPASTTCSTLFANAHSLAGDAPADTVQAILNISHHPGANVANLFALAAAAPPFVPNLGSNVPNDLTLALNFHGGASGGVASLATDIQGNVWLAYYTSSTVVELSPSGEVQATYSGDVTGISFPSSIAIDPFNNVWVDNCGTNCDMRGTGNDSLTKIASGGSPIAVFPQNNDTSAGNIVANGEGDVYSTAGGQISKYSNTGVPAGAPFPITNSPVSITLDGTGSIYTPLLGGPGCIDVRDSAGTRVRNFCVRIVGGTTIIYYGATIDRDGALWLVGSVFFGSSGTWGLAKVPAGESAASVAIHSGGPADGGLAPNAIAIITDGSGTAWVANHTAGTVSAYTSAGVALSPPLSRTGGGYQAGLAGSSSIAIDTAGNVWVADPVTGTIGELVGAATPVTPLAVGVRNGTVGQRP